MNIITARLSLFEQSYKLTYDNNKPVVLLRPIVLETKEDKKCYVETKDGKTSIFKKMMDNNFVVIYGLGTNTYTEDEVITFHTDLYERKANKELIIRRKMILKFLNTILDQDKTIGNRFYKEMSNHAVPDKTMYYALTQRDIEYSSIMTNIHEKNIEMHNTIQAMVDIHPEFRSILIYAARQSQS